MKKSLFMVSLLVIGVITFYACKHEVPQLPDTGSEIPGATGRVCSPDTVYFSNDILPLISSSCAMSGCHDAITRNDGVQLTSYNTIKRYIIPGNAAASKLYKVCVKTGSERMPPPPAPAMTAEQVAKIRSWINQGAMNNACDRCDTIDFKYSTAIKPLLQTKCQGCHNPANLGGGIDLSTYAATKPVALNGKLYASINWSSGFSAMPKGGVKMPACEITQIKKWADGGAPNN